MARTTRSKGITVMVTPAQYEEMGRKAGTARVSDWAHTKLLEAMTRRPFEEAVLAEVLALRAIVITLQMRLASGALITVDNTRSLVKTADENKYVDAIARLTVGDD